MLIEVLIAVCSGVLAGIFTGLIPGIHINLVALGLLTASPILLRHISPLPLACFVIAMSVTHSFLDFIPSVYLGAPDPDTALSILPGHKLLLAGKGYDAVRLTLIGSLISLVLCVILTPLLLVVFPIIYPFFSEHMALLLCGIILFLATRGPFFLNLAVFLATGLLGLAVLSLPNLPNPLFPLLSGLFGVSTLLLSLNSDSKLPEQTTEASVMIDQPTTLKAAGLATIAGSLTGLLPGLGAAQGAALATTFAKGLGEFGFMIMLGGINTANFVVSLATLLTMGKARNGAVIAVSQLLEMDKAVLVVFLAVAVIAGAASVFIAIGISKQCSKAFSRVPYKKLVMGIIMLLVAMTFGFSGFLGLLVLLTSTAIGLIAPLKGVGRHFAMGCLILPVVVFLSS